MFILCSVKHFQPLHKTQQKRFKGYGKMKNCWTWCWSDNLDGPFCLWSQACMIQKKKGYQVVFCLIRIIAIEKHNCTVFLNNVLTSTENIQSWREHDAVCGHKNSMYFSALMQPSQKCKWPLTLTLTLTLNVGFH